MIIAVLIARPYKRIRANGWYPTTLFQRAKEAKQSLETFASLAGCVMNSKARVPQM
jgi:hypothetical protein